MRKKNLSEEAKWEGQEKHTAIDK
ncbi:uncharacterized protein G2W53_038762 [Senna tora]|uniref:Uncharacterized protein n=1 Tax=Senna tora TaxID=362788 RepID=A0A834W5I4_9FABA|nr:uncharacterized protein G2W53_038762 [Senna tora]